MRLLFEIDAKDYDPAGRRFYRPSVRGIIIRENRVAMIHSLAFDYYKFPGGGMEPGEDQLETLIREVREETGLAVDPASVREYGWVHRIHRSHRPTEEIFVQENYDYLCDAPGEPGETALTPKEAEERFVLEFVDPQAAIRANEAACETAAWHKPAIGQMAAREAGVLRKLYEEGYLH